MQRHRGQTGIDTSVVLPPVVRQATLDDARTVDEMLQEAAAWVDALGPVMWEDGELDPGRTRDEIAAGQFFLAGIGAETAGAVRFQLDDALFWPDLPGGDSAFVHRLVVRRRFRGRGVSDVLLRWAAERAASLGRHWLRLDCDASRTKLCALYERAGFRLHSHRQVGPYYVARYEQALRS